MRVNNDGHLVSFWDYQYFAGFDEISEENPSEVLHPGADTDYESYEERAYGSLHFYLDPLSNISVEGNGYAVTVFKGDFTPVVSGDNPELKTIEYNYAPTIGLVKRVCHHTLGDHSWEDRLVAYRLN